MNNTQDNYIRNSTTGDCEQNCPSETYICKSNEVCVPQPFSDEHGCVLFDCVCANGYTLNEKTGECDQVCSAKTQCNCDKNQQCEITFNSVGCVQTTCVCRDGYKNQTPNNICIKTCNHFTILATVRNGIDFVSSSIQSNHQQVRKVR